MACQKILVVEDDPDVREAITEVLQMEDFGVETASNGQEALEKLKQATEPCLILLDLMMPVMNGWEFLEMKNHKNMLASIPVLVVSALGDRVPKQAGITGQLKKPVDLESLLKIAQIYCRSAAATQRQAA